MTDAPAKSPLAPSVAPTLRWIGIGMAGIAMIGAVMGAWFGVTVEPLQNPDSDSLLDHEAIFRQLSMVSAASLGHDIVGDGAIAVLLIGVARRATAGPRLAASIAAVAKAVLVAALVVVFADNIDPQPSEPGSTDHWYLASAFARVGFAVALAGLLYGYTRAQPRRAAALAAASVGLGAAMVLLYATLDLEGGDLSPSVWRERFAHIGVLGWLDLLGNLSLAAALWLATGPEDDTDRAALDQSAAVGLRWARRAIWLRVLLASTSVGLVVAGNVALQRVASQAMFGSSPAPAQLPWTLRAAPWLGHGEAILGGLVVVGLAGAVVQSRSRLGAGLVGLGVLLLMGSAAISFGLNTALHTTLGTTSSLTSLGSSMRDFAKVTEQIDPTLRGLGVGGLVCTLLGLMSVAKTIGQPRPRRAVRFMIIAAVFTAGWLYGREALGGLGAGVLLLAPVVLGAAIWALLDLTTYLREVAAALEEPAKAAEGPQEDGKSPS